MTPENETPAEETSSPATTEANAAESTDTEAPAAEPVADTGTDETDDQRIYREKLERGEIEPPKTNEAPPEQQGPTLAVGVHLSYALSLADADNVTAQLRAEGGERQARESDVFSLDVTAVHNEGGCISGNVSGTVDGRGFTLAVTSCTPAKYPKQPGRWSWPE